MALPDQHISGFVLGQTAFVNFTFRANPQPRVEWYVDVTSVPQGAQRERFEATIPQATGPGEWMVTLVIADLNLEDTTKEYYLKASNEFGAQEYKILINSSNNDESKLNTLKRPLNLSLNPSLSFSRWTCYRLDCSDCHSDPDRHPERGPRGRGSSHRPLVLCRSVLVHLIAVNSQETLVK